MVSQHVPYEGPGLVAECLEDAGWGSTCCAPTSATASPTPPGWVAWWSWAGPMGVADGATHPWLAPSGT